MVLAISIAYVMQLSRDVELKKTSSYIGEQTLRQKKLVDTNVRNIDLWVKQSAKYSSKQAVYDLGKQGGFYKTPGCGSYSGYNLLSANGNECYPNARKDFELLMQENLDDYMVVLSSFLKKSDNRKDAYIDEDIPTKNYDFFITGNTLVGIATQNVQLGLWTAPGLIMSQGRMGDLAVNPSFKIEMPFDLSIYDEIIQDVPDLKRNIIECEKNKKIEECLQQETGKLSTPKLTWSTECEGAGLSQLSERAFGFCIDTGKFVFAHDKITGTVDNHRVIFKFGLHIPRADIESD